MVEREALTDILETARRLLYEIDNTLLFSESGHEDLASLLAHHIVVSAEAGLSVVKPKTNEEVMWDFGLAYSRMMGEVGG